MPKKRIKIALIGAGSIGGTLAHIISIKRLGDIVMLDTLEGMSQGKALDISQALSIYGSDIKITGTCDYSSITDSDAIIITAGVPRKPGMSRNDLLSINHNVMQTVGNAVRTYAPNAFVIIITNPLDAMAYSFLKASRLSHQKVVGMAGTLDTARLNRFLADEFQVSVESVNSFVLGGHGDSMVPLVRYSTIGGIPVPDLIKMGLSTTQKIDSIVDRTRGAGGEIVNLLQTGSAYYAPAASAIEMLESYLLDKRKLLSCSAYLQGEYGFNDLYVGVPVIIGANGVEKIIEINLNEEEKAAFLTSVTEIQKLIQFLQS